MTPRKLIAQGNDEDVWTQCDHHTHARTDHKAVLEPSSRRLWLIGGSKSWDHHEDHLRELTFSSDQKLKVLALESVVENFDKLAPDVKMLPQDLQLAVRDRVRRKYVIT